MAIPTFQRSGGDDIFWRKCLASAFRTALACSIVGVATLFGPAALRRQAAFPAFSYVTVILIVTDTATLGDAFRGCWHALYGTCQGVCPAILSLWLIGPARLTASTTAAAVALSAFVVVLPENTHFIAKRIALGQTVIVYTTAYLNGGKAQYDAVMHPVRVAASTAVGVTACILALLFPYPALACSEVKNNCELFAENVSERFNLLVKAFSAEDNTSAMALVSQAKSLGGRGAKLLQNIKSKQESMHWERYPIKFLRSYCKNPGERLQEYETPLRGLEIALAENNNLLQFPLISEIKDSLESLTLHVSKQVNNIPVDLATVPEPNSENSPKFFQTLHSTVQPVMMTPQNLPSFFFLFCLNLFMKNPFLPSPSPPKDDSKKQEQEEEEWSLKKVYNNLANKSFMGAFKCSLSLGLAVFFGSVYSKPNGIWAGLPVAISYVSAREATFKIANVKAQGTVLGSIYGVLGCFVFEKYTQIRFISLIPWFIVCSLLRRSKMYGQAGGISACIGAILILGRKGYGPPSEFAIARITETFIGLSCSIFVEILLQPTRASSLAKIQLSKSLQILNECITSISLIEHSKHLSDVQKNLKMNVNLLGKFVGEAEAEPNFWFLPFHSGCYGKLVGSMSRILEYLHFVAQALRFLEQESSRDRADSNNNSLLKTESLNKTDSVLCSLFRDYVGPSIKRCEEVIAAVGSIPVLDKEFEKKKGSIDLELGKLPKGPSNNVVGLSEEEIEKKLKSFVEDSREFVVVRSDGDGDEVKSQVVLSLSALVFCIKSIIKETKEIEKAIKEVVQLENPSSPVNLHEISCKIRALAHTVTN